MNDPSEQPASVPAPEPPAKERFYLSPRDGLVFLCGAAVIALTLPQQKCWSDPWERLLPYAAGLFLGLLLMGVVSAAIMFYLCGRSRTAASLTFSIMVVLSTIGQVHKVAREQAACDRAALAKRFSPRFHQWLKDQLDSYQKVGGEVLRQSPMRPGWAKEKADVVRAREAIDRAQAANRRLRGLYGRATLFARKELTAEGVPEHDLAVWTAAVIESFAGTEKMFAAMRDDDDGILTEYRRACDMLIEHWDHWHCDAKAGSPIFDEASARQEFAAIAARLAELTQTCERHAAELRRATQGGKKT